MRERPMNAFLAQALRDAHARRATAGDAAADARAADGAAADAAAADARVAVRRDAAGLDALAMAAGRGDVEALGRLYDTLVGPIYRYVAVRVRRR
jgi:hypothetical protein